MSADAQSTVIAPVLVEPPRIAKRWAVLSFFIMGRRSYVYHGVDETTMCPVVIKLATYSLLREYNALRHLDSLNCVPKVLHFDDAYADGTQSVLVLEASGYDLRLWPGPVPNTTELSTVFLFVLSFMEKALWGLSAIHESGLVHGDIKPTSVLSQWPTTSSQPSFGRPDQSKSYPGPGAKLVFCGFNNARKLDGPHAPKTSNTPAFRPKADTIASARFCSPDVMRGGCPTAKDDLYSLCIVAVYLLFGARLIPWHEECKKEDARLEWITTTKDNTRGAELFEASPPVFCDFYEYIRNIPSGAIPDYAFWVQRFGEVRKTQAERTDITMPLRL